MGLTIQGGCVTIALDEVCGTDNENTTDRKISSIIYLKRERKQPYRIHVIIK